MKSTRHDVLYPPAKQPLWSRGNTYPRPSVIEVNGYLAGANPDADEHNYLFQVNSDWNAYMDNNTRQLQPDVVVGLLAESRVTNDETDFAAACLAGYKVLFTNDVVFTAARALANQVEISMDSPDAAINIATFDFTLKEVSGYIGITTSGGKLILDGVTHGLIIRGSVTVEEGVNFSGSYVLNGVQTSVSKDIANITQEDHVILTSAKQALYANDDKILRVDPDGVTFKKRDGTPVVIGDNKKIVIDSIEQLTNNLHFDSSNSDIEVLRHFQIDTNGNKVFFNGSKNRIYVHTTEDFDNGLEAETEENQRVVKNRNMGNVIWLNNRRIFSGSRPKEEPFPVSVDDPYVISQNGFSYNGHELGSPADECLFKDWWYHWGGRDLVGDGSILIAPVFNIGTVLNRKVFTDDPAGRFTRYATPIGGSTGVDPDVHSRTSPVAAQTIATYTSGGTNEISGISDADALKLRIGARVADAGLGIPQGSSGTPKTTIILSIVHNSPGNNSIFLIDSETGSSAPVSATGNLTIDQSGNVPLSHGLDAMQRIKGETDLATNLGALKFTASPSGVFVKGSAQTVFVAVNTEPALNLGFDSSLSTSPNPAKTSEYQTHPISKHRKSYLIL